VEVRQVEKARLLAYSSTTIKHGPVFLTGPDAIPLPIDPPVFVITASNPFGTALPPVINEDRRLRLYRAIGELRSNASLIETTGWSQDGQWEEQGWGISGLSLEKALSLARMFNQEAIFCLTPDDKELIALSGAVLLTTSRFL